MNDYGQKTVELMQSIKEGIEKNNSEAERFNIFEKSVEGRLLELETSVRKYESFIDKTSGFFTRIGFYLDGVVMYFKVRFGKK